MTSSTHDQLDTESLRRDYTAGELNRSDLLPTPIGQFETWLQDAVSAGVIDPTAMAVATVDEQNRPCSRVVLLKGFSEDGFIFYTNTESNKANQIKQNNQVCLHFFWSKLDRQIIINGEAERLKTTEVLAYALKRPRESQIAAWASQQSRRISSRQLLEQKFLEMKQKFEGGQIPVPSFLGGYRIKPYRFEFWQGRVNRLHDRFIYTLDENEGWSIERLQP